MSLELPRLPQKQPSWGQMQVWWQQVAEAVEAHENALEEQLTEIEAAQARADAAIRRIAIAGSYTTGGAPLSASDAGTSATITVANHTRNYSAETDYPPVPIVGGTVTGLAYSTEYFVYYDDPTLAATHPVFHATTVGVDAQANKVAGRHPLGPITTPTAGGGSSSGGGSAPPAGGGGYGGGGGILP